MYCTLLSPVGTRPIIGCYATNVCRFLSLMTLFSLGQNTPVVTSMDRDGGSKDTIPRSEYLGQFIRKCREADCHLINSEPYSPWQISAEGLIKELKKASLLKPIYTGSPKVLWDHCIELMSLIRSHTAHTSYDIQGEVPETIMTG